MSEKLLEADLPTVDLRSILSVAAISQESTEVDYPETYDDKWWANEFNRRLDKNKNMPNAYKKPDVEVESEFFRDFFTRNWPTAASKLLAIGAPLIKAIKVIGFKIKLEAGGNPLLAFVAQKFVQEQLLIPGFLNINTFKAIYNAVAKKLVAHSEFFEENNYNLIYCIDLYKKPVNKIEEYLKEQSEVLSTSASEYSSAKQEYNKKVFLHTEKISELDLEKRAREIRDYAGLPEDIQSVQKATLNSLDLARTIRGKGTGEQQKTRVGHKQLQDIIDLITTPAEIFAAIQYLSFVVGSQMAAEALTKIETGGIDVKAVAQASKKLMPILAKKSISKPQAETIVAKLMDKQ